MFRNGLIFLMTTPRESSLLISALVVAIALGIRVTVRRRTQRVAAMGYSVPKTSDNQDEGRDPDLIESRP